MLSMRIDVCMCVSAPLACYNLALWCLCAWSGCLDYSCFEWRGWGRICWRSPQLDPLPLRLPGWESGAPSETGQQWERTQLICSSCCAWWPSWMQHSSQETDSTPSSKQIQGTDVYPGPTRRERLKSALNLRLKKRLFNLSF